MLHIGYNLFLVRTYGIIIYAMSLGPMGPVSALRETSVVFAAVIGRLFLDEHLSVHRIAACSVVALGAICIGHAGRSQHAVPVDGQRSVEPLRARSPAT